MDPLLVMIAAFVFGGLKFVRVSLLLGRAPEGTEREELRNSLWFHGGAAAILLGVVMGELPLSLPSAASWTLFGIGAGLFLTGGIEFKRLAAAKRRELFRAWADATSLVDRIEVLEAERMPYRRLPLKQSFISVGGMALLAGTGLWILSWTLNSLQCDPRMVLASGTMVALGVGGLGWEITRAFRRKSERDRIDGEIAALLDPGSLPAPEGGGPDELI